MRIEAVGMGAQPVVSEVGFVCGRANMQAKGQK